MQAKTRKEMASAAGKQTAPLDALDALGGEPLAGSGFETEKPEPGFANAAVPLPAGAAIAPPEK